MIVLFCWVNNSIYCFIIRKIKETHYFTWKVMTQPHTQLFIGTWMFMRSNIEANHHPIVPFTFRLVIRMTSKYGSIAYILKVCKELFHIIKKEIFVFVWKFTQFLMTELKHTWSCKYFFPHHTGTQTPFSPKVIRKAAEFGSFENSMCVGWEVCTSRERNSDWCAFLISIVSSKRLVTWEANNGVSAGRFAVSINPCSVGKLS